MLPGRCEGEELQDDVGEREKRRAGQREQASKAAAGISRIIKFHYRAVIIETVHARITATPKSRETSPSLPYFAITTLVFANEHASANHIRVLAAAPPLHRNDVESESTLPLCLALYRELSRARATMIMMTFAESPGMTESTDQECGRFLP